MGTFKQMVPLGSASYFAYGAVIPPCHSAGFSCSEGSGELIHLEKAAAYGLYTIWWHTAAQKEQIGTEKPEKAPLHPSGIRWLIRKYNPTLHVVLESNV